MHVVDFDGRIPHPVTRNCSFSSIALSRLNSCYRTIIIYIATIFYPATTDVMIYYIAENAVYGDNEAELNAYDVAKAVYEPVKDNEKIEGQNSVCHVFICL